VARRIEVIIAGDAKDAERAFGSAADASGKLGKAAKVAALGGLAAIAVGLKSSADKAMEAQTSQVGMETALGNAGIAYDKHAKQIEAVIQKTSKLAALDDEDLQGAFTNLVRTTGNVNKALKDTALAADISRGKHISLEAATNLVTKAELGKGGALTKAGIAVEKGATSVELLDTLHRKFAGSAEAYGKTSQGALERSQVATENLQEAIGSGLLPIQERLATVLATVAGWLSEHTTVAKILIGVVGGLALGVLAVSAATSVWAAATSVAAAAQFVLDAALAANPIGLVIIGLVALGAALVVAYRHSETFRNIVTGALDAVKVAGQKVVDFVTVQIPAAFQTVLGWLRSSWPIVAVLVSGPFAPLVALATNAFGIRDKFEGALTAIKNAVSGTVSAIVGFFASLPGKIVGFASSVGTTFISSLESGLSGLGAALGRAIRAPLNALIGGINSIAIPAFNIHIGMPSPIPDINVGYGGSGPLFHISTLAAGGIVTSPTLAMIGERGPEAVIPLSRGGAGTTVIVNAPNYVGSKQELMGVVIAELARYSKRNGGLGFA
jgi:hypothetical protein